MQSFQIFPFVSFSQDATKGYTALKLGNEGENPRNSFGVWKKRMPTQERVERI